MHKWHTGTPWHSCNQSEIVLNFMPKFQSRLNGIDKQQLYRCIRVHLMHGNSFFGNNYFVFTQTSNHAHVPLDSGFELSDIVVNLCSKLLDYVFLKAGSKYIYLSIGYAHIPVLHCVIKLAKLYPRPKPCLSLHSVENM